MSADFERAWPYLEPAVERAQQYDKASLLAEIERGQTRLWVLPNSAITTKVLKYPSGRKTFGIWLAGGELNELKDWTTSDGLKAALVNQCNEMRVLCGRRGWVRVLGWRDVGTTAVWDFDNA